jgi:hypothetical protein
MQLQAFFVLASCLGAGFASILNVEASQKQALDNRATAECNYNGCQCSDATQGQYCGWCREVTLVGKKGALGHVYECSPSGDCCDYGVADDCASGVNMRCGKRRETIA